MCRKQVELDFFNTTVLRETIMQILDRFKSIGSPHHWVNYIMPEDARFYASSDNRIPSVVTKFDQLMVETRSVLARYFYYV
jgi:peroxin-3